MTLKRTFPPRAVQITDDEGRLWLPAIDEAYHTLIGKHYIASKVYRGIANNNYVYLLLVPNPNVGTMIKNVLFVGEGDMLVQVYVDPDITDNGDEIPSFNANDTITTSPTLKIYEWPSWNDMGTLLEEVYLSGTGAQMHPLELFKYRFIRDHKYLVAIKNVSGNNMQYLSLTMRFCEEVI